MKTRNKMALMALLVCPLILASMIPVASAGTDAYSWAADGGFEGWPNGTAGAPAIIGLGNNTLCAVWTASGGVWDVYLFTAAQYAVWVLDKSNTTLPAVERHLDSASGSFIRTDLSTNTVYKFTAYVQAGGMRAISVTLVWEYKDPGIPGFELILVVFSLFGLLLIYLQKKPRTL